MPSRPKVVEATLEAQTRYARTSSLKDALDVLLDEVGRHTPFDQRLVAVAALEGHAVGTAVDVPEDEVSAFVEAVARRGVLPALSSSPDSSLSALPSLPSAVLVSVGPSAASGFAAAVVLEADPDHPELRGVREILQDAAPFILRRAEVHALRNKLATAEGKERRSRRALDALPDPILVMDAQSRILLANRRAEELLMTSPGDGPGRRRAVETNNLFFSAFRARAALEGDRGSESRELILIDPNDGSDLLFEVFLSPYRAFGTPSEHAIFVLRDITDLKQAALQLELQFGRSVAAEHRARRESERLNVIIENAGVPILVTDRHTNVVLMNREAERLLAVGPSGSRSLPRDRDVHDNDARLAGFINEFLLQSRLRREGRLTLVDPDEAREFPALAVCTKVLDERYEPTGVVTVLHDLTHETENERLAEKLRRLNAELEERVAAATRELAERNAQLEGQRTELERASRMKTEFLATMSHELRTPINAVLGYNSLLREGIFGDLTAKQEDALRRMRNAAEHLLSLINDILDLSRVESGKMQMNPSDIDLRPFLDELSESVRPMTSTKSLEYEVVVDPDVPPIRTDATRLRQVLLNLLSNAAKFTDAGSVTLRAALAGSGAGIRLDVTDTGIGISEQNLETIFDAFTQADQSATREHGGTGLGLTISRRLIQAMGGSLTVSSAIGCGTTFRVELPLHPPIESSDAGRSAPGEPRAGAP